MSWRFLSPLWYPSKLRFHFVVMFFPVFISFSMLRLFFIYSYFFSSSFKACVHRFWVKPRRQMCIILAPWLLGTSHLTCFVKNISNIQLTYKFTFAFALAFATSFLFPFYLLYFPIRPVWTWLEYTLRSFRQQKIKHQHLPIIWSPSFSSLNEVAD